MPGSFSRSLDGAVFMLIRPASSPDALCEGESAMPTDSVGILAQEQSVAMQQANSRKARRKESRDK
jgi:hypothetical protein